MRHVFFSALVFAPHPVCNIEIFGFAFIVMNGDGFSARVDVSHRLVTAPNMASA